MNAFGNGMLSEMECIWKWNKFGNGINFERGINLEIEPQNKTKHEGSCERSMNQ